jgi:hypothetical protein
VNRWFSRTKLAVMLAISTVLLMFSVAWNVSGASTLVEIQAYLNNGIKVVLHGKPFEPVDPDDGSKYVPITYNGRTYLPLRAVAEGAGLKVTWDANTGTAYLGDTEGTIEKQSISYIRVSPEFARVNEGLYRLKNRMPEYLNRAPGKTFEYGYSGDSGYYAGMSMTVITNFEYDKFKATFWIDEEKDENGEYTGSDPVIEFRDENSIPVKKFDVEYGKLYDIELDIKDVMELEVWASGSLSIIGEPMIGK